MALRCKHCYGIINSDIYAHWQLTRNNKTFNFCQPICVDAYLDRCDGSYTDVEHIAIGDKKVLEDEVVENRWSILDLRKE